MIIDVPLAEDIESGLFGRVEAGRLARRALQDGSGVESFLARMERVVADAAAARNELVLNYAVVVSAVIDDFRELVSYPQDVVDAGVRGLVRAIDTFDHTRTAAFIDYAGVWVRLFVLHEVVDDIRLEGIHDSLIPVFNELARAHVTIVNSTPSTIVEELAVSPIARGEGVRLLNEIELTYGEVFGASLDDDDDGDDDGDDSSRVVLAEVRHESGDRTKVRFTRALDDVQNDAEYLDLGSSCEAESDIPDDLAEIEQLERELQF